MRFFNRANRLERLQRRAVANGELIDVTSVARQLGMQDSVFISKRLWLSLLQPFPFAEPKDCVLLETLLRALLARIRAVNPDDNRVLVLLPPDIPEWFRACYLKLSVDSFPEGPRSIVVQPYADPFATYRRTAEHTFPATLLVQLAKTVRNLIFVSRTAEQGLLRSLESIVNQLIGSNPFHCEINHHLGPFLKELSLPVPPEEYRSVLLADLDEQLAILARCADRQTRPKIDTMKSYYRALVSPLAAFCQLLEQLLQVVARGSSLNTPVQSQVVLHLLHLYAEVHARLQRLETEVSTDGLAVVRFQIRLLAPSLGTSLAEYITGLERACSDLLISRLPNCTHGPSRHIHSSVVWH